MPARLELCDIHKRFGSVHALRGANFTLRQGEVHALLGENGAGKSTLMGIAAGLIRPDRGATKVNGSEAVIHSPRVARDLGIGMVHQHFTSILRFTVAENMALSAGWPVEPRGLKRRSESLIERLNFRLDWSTPAAALAAVDLQRLEILRALASNASVLLLDEPTAALAPDQAAQFFRLVRQLAGAGASVVLITHQLGEALEYADTVTVLRRGQVTMSQPVQGLTAADLAVAMLGEALPPEIERATTTPGPATVLARDVSIPAIGRGPGLRHATFELREGEVVGVAAVEGNGERELLRGVAGLVAVAEGVLQVQEPAGFVPEDRTTEGIIGDFDLIDNFLLGFGSPSRWIQSGLINRTRARSETAALLTQHGIVAASPESLAASLSGGNQQKLILARAVASGSRVIVAENPSRGLDVRAAVAGLSLLRDAARKGASVLLYSADLDELITWCDRVIVVAAGRILHPARGATSQEIGELMLRVDGAGQA